MCTDILHTHTLHTQAHASGHTRLVTLQQGQVTEVHVCVLLALLKTRVKWFPCRETSSLFFHTSQIWLGFAYDQNFPLKTPEFT